MKLLKYISSYFRRKVSIECISYKIAWLSDIEYKHSMVFKIPHIRHDETVYDKIVTVWWKSFTDERIYKTSMYQQLQKKTKKALRWSGHNVGVILFTEVEI